MWKRSTISNAGHASISSSGETKLIEILVDARGLEILGDDTRTWGKGCPDVGLGVESFLKSLLCEKAGLKHDAWI